MNLGAHNLLVLCILGACAARPGAGDESTTDNTGAGLSETGVAVTTTSTTTTPTTSTTLTTAEDPSDTSDTTLGPTSTGETTGDDTGNFIIPGDGGTGPVCDPFAQDCAPGSKCTWWGEGGALGWNSNKCVPLTRDPAQVGEPCVAEGNGFTGVDDCELGALCWQVDDNGDGTCVALCGGNPLEPTCPQISSCAISGDGFSVCLEPCDPLAQDCPGDQLCIPAGQSYTCLFDDSGPEGQLHDPCEFANGCDPGLLCMPPSSASECAQDKNGCCEPICDLGEPNTCPGAGQTCIPLLEPPPEGFEHIGICDATP